MSHQHDHSCGSDCTCGCSQHREESENKVLKLTIDDGSVLECEVIGTFEYDNKDYIVLLPKGEEDAFIYGYREEGEEIELRKIEEDVEFEAATEYFLSIIEE